MSGNGDNKNTVVILSACPVSEKMKAYIPQGAYLIACDAGYRNAQRLEIIPDLVVGDFDSAPQPREKNLVVLPHEKDDTDTQYAARLALERKAEKVIILGGLGGTRLEHTLANLATGLWLEKQGVSTILANEESRIHFLIPGKDLVLSREDWKYLSVLPLEGEMTGVDIQGAYYPLENARLTSDYPLGVSNEFAADKVTLRCRKGGGAVILTNTD